MHNAKNMSFRATVRESRNPRIWFASQIKLVRRSFDSLRSLRMTAAFVVVLLYVLMDADNHEENLYMVDEFSK